MQSLLDDHEPGKLDLLALIARHRGKMLLTFLAGIALTLGYFSTASRKFKSEAKLFLRLGRESVSLDPTATNGPYLSSGEARGSEIYAVEELLSSRPLAEKIVDQYGPETILERGPDSGPSLGERLAPLDSLNLNLLRVYSLRDKAIKAFQETLKVNTGNKSSVVSLSYVSQDPKLAQCLLDSLIAMACDEHLRVHRTRGSQEFFVGQCALQRGELARLEQQLRDLKNDTGVASLGIQREIQLQLAGKLQEDLLRSQTELDSVRAELDRRREQMSDLQAMSVVEQTTGQPQTIDQKLRERLFELEVKQADFSAQFTAEHPQVTLIRDQLADARQVASTEKATTQIRTGVNQVHQTSDLSVREREASLVALTARTDSLRDKIAAVQTDLKALNNTELAVNRLEREIDLARANSRKYSENLELARINQELEEAKISSLNVLQAPSFTETPYSPRPLPTLAVGLVVALMGSFGVALLADRRLSAKQSLPTPPAANAVETSLVAARPKSLSRHSEVAPANPR